MTLDIPEELINEKNVNLYVETPLKKGTFSIAKLWVTEAVSNFFEIEILLTSNKMNIDFSLLIGKSITVTIDFGGYKRYFNGLVGHFSQLETSMQKSRNTTYYKAKLYPNIWRLSFSKNFRIFQDQNALSIIKSIFTEENIIEVQDRTTFCGRKVRKYCTQYDESNFDFVNRLMQEEGIFYFFEHYKDRHILVLGDTVGVYDDCKNITKIKMEDSRSDGSFFNVITECKVEQQVVPSSYLSTDFNFKNSSRIIKATSKGVGEGGVVCSTQEQMGHEDEPTQVKAESLSNIRLEAEEMMKKTMSGSSTAPNFSPGYCFNLINHVRLDTNGRYVLYEVKHYAELSKLGKEDKVLYENTFFALPSSVVIRPKLRMKKPKIYGTQTAIVTGPEGEEVWIDEYARVTVRFLWDNSNTSDSASSCKVRVMQPWTGNNWGALFIPRIGQEVVISFINGDPDRPLINGAVYNGDNTIPYPPSEATKTTIKTNSSKGGEGFNELSFEDKKGSEKVYIHAEKDYDSEINENRNNTIFKGSDTNLIKSGDRTTILAAEPGAVDGKGDDRLVLDKGSRFMILSGKGDNEGSYNINISKGDRVLNIEKGSEKINLSEGSQNFTLSKGNRTTLLSAGNDVTTLSSGYSETVVTAGYHNIRIVKGNQKITLNAGNRTITINGNETKNIKGDKEEKTTGTWKVQSVGDIELKTTGNIKLEAAQKITIKAGMDIELEAGMNVTNKAGMKMENKAGMNLTNEAGLKMENKANLDMTLDSTLNMNVKGMLGTFDNKLKTDIKGVMSKVDASAMNEVTAGALLKAGGAITQLG